MSLQHFYNAVDAFAAQRAWEPVIDDRPECSYPAVSKRDVVQASMRAFAELMEHTSIDRTTMYWAVSNAAAKRRHSDF